MATSFSFHCMICYESFDNSVSRYPVVLPCGHTYVCNACGERLDRCMECRTPLYLTFDPNEGKPHASGSPGSWNHRGATTSSSAAGSRAPLSRAGMSASPVPQAPPKLVKKRMPLPKNVVLLSLIEATELATADVHQAHLAKSEDSVEEAPPTPEVRPEHKAMIHSMHSLDEEERNEEERIHLATSLSVGVGGTYAVAAKEGLAMYAQRPSKLTSVEQQAAASSGTNGAEDDVDGLVDDFHKSQKEPKEGTHVLDYGDRVQIVAIDKDGWAKLARGYGYVRADRNQIIKVGGAVDKACRLEAMLRIVSQERKRLRREQAKIDNSFIRLMNELQHSLENDEDLTVICRSTFTELDTSQNGFDIEQPILTEEKKENREIEPNTPRSAPPDMPSPNSLTHADSPNSLPFYPPKHSSRALEDHSLHQTSLICFSPEEFLQPESIAESFSMTDVTASARQLLGGGPASPSRATVQPQVQGDLSSSAYPTQSEMLAGARAWRERHGRPAATGVDFRTGMSGHAGVMSSKQGHPHDYLDNNESIRKPVNFRMSSHTGLTMGRRRNSMGHSVPMRSGMWGNPRSSPGTAARTSPARPSNYTSTGTP